MSSEKKQEIDHLLAVVARADQEFGSGLSQIAEHLFLHKLTRGSSLDSIPGLLERLNGKSDGDQPVGESRLDSRTNLARRYSAAVAMLEGMDPQGVADMITLLREARAGESIEEEMHRITQEAGQPTREELHQPTQEEVHPPMKEETVPAVKEEVHQQETVQPTKEESHPPMQEAVRQPLQEEVKRPTQEAVPLSELHQSTYEVVRPPKQEDLKPPAQEEVPPTKQELHPNMQEAVQQSVQEEVKRPPQEALHPPQSNMVAVEALSHVISCLRTERTRPLQKLLYDKLGTGAPQRLYLAGEVYGIKIATEFMNKGLGIEKTIREIERVSNLAGWGDFSFHRTELRKVECTIKNTIFNYKRDEAKNSCHFTAGLAAGIISTLLYKGGRFVSTEVECVSDGSGHCRFEIVSTAS